MRGHELMTTTETLAAELAASLFTLRAAQESDLRTLTWIQRNLEGVRSGCAPGDTDLLLGEMARLLAESVRESQVVIDARSAAVDLLERILDARRASVCKPVAVAAA